MRTPSAPGVELVIVVDPHAARLHPNDDDVAGGDRSVLAVHAAGDAYSATQTMAVKTA